MDRVEIERQKRLDREQNLTISKVKVCGECARPPVRPPVHPYIHASTHPRLDKDSPSLNKDTQSLNNDNSSLKRDDLSLNRDKPSLHEALQVGTTTLQV